MGYLKYKGYIGSVEYSEEDKCLFGKVQGMTKDCITYEGATVEELTADFEGAVDDYLQLCIEKGIEPECEMLKLQKQLMEYFSERTIGI